MEIIINKSENEIEIIKDESKRYAEISKHTHILTFSFIAVSFIIAKITGNFTLSSFLPFIFLIGFPIYLHSAGLRNKCINEVLRVNLDNIKLEFLKEGDIVYSKEIPRWKVIQIKKKIPIFNFYPNVNSIDILNRELTDKRILKIMTKDEIHSWGYKVEEEKIGEIIKLIEEFWNFKN